MRRAVLIAVAIAIAAPLSAPPPASAAWRSCTGTVTVQVAGKAWKLARFRVSNVGCVKGKSVARRCTATACPAPWKHKVDFVAGRPPVWWHTAWMYGASGQPLMIQWRAVRG